MQKNILLVTALSFLLIAYGCGKNKKNDEPQSSDTSVTGRDISVERKEAEKGNPGESVYRQYCAACHQINGTGVPRMYPPLTPNEYIASKEKVILIVLKGMKGKIEVNGETYNNYMASLNMLTDAEIASVISYVRSAFGNKLDPVSEEEVAAFRKK